jgi:hypothetical protein
LGLLFIFGFACYDAEDQTEDLMHATQELSHSATSPAPPVDYFFKLPGKRSCQRQVVGNPQIRYSEIFGFQGY